jgi:hypothetical protein
MEKRNIEANQKYAVKAEAIYQAKLAEEKKNETKSQQ